MGVVIPPPLVIGPLFLTLALLPVLVQEEAPLLHAPSNVTVGGRPFMSVSYTLTSAPVVAAILLASAVPVLRLAVVASLVSPRLLFMGIGATYVTLVVPVTLSFLVHTGAAWVAAIAVGAAVAALPFTRSFKRALAGLMALTLLVGTGGFLADGLPWPWLFYSLEAVVLLVLASAASNIEPTEQERLQKERTRGAAAAAAADKARGRSAQGRSAQAAVVDRSVASLACQP